MNSNFLKWAKKYHKWPALFISLFLILFSLSGIIMNHRQLFSGFNVKRKYLPSEYNLQNWNLGAVRSAAILKDGSRLIYGNSGIWKTDSVYSGFIDFNSGLPEGMDMRKVRAVKECSDGSLLAGTFFGLYKYSNKDKIWTRINLPLKNERVQDIQCRNNEVIVLTRSEIITFDLKTGFEKPSVIRLNAPVGYDNKMSLFRFLWILHSGEIAGMAGRIFLDFLALLIIFLVTTGLVIFFVPKLSKRLKSGSGSLPEFRRKNLQLHNITGAWFIIFLVAVPLTGMFLRPPFLIPVANAKIPVLPLKIAGKDNPWEDKMRAIIWSEERAAYILSASDGFYYVDSIFRGAPEIVEFQPPVSVMGINVFDYYRDGYYYVGSFDGLFLWNPSTDEVLKMDGTRIPATSNRTGGRPSSTLISGMISDGTYRIIFDYDRGVSDGTFPPMPSEIIKKSPMPLWNVAQEIHTGRIYQFFMGPFYILIVPLVGLFTILVLITGYIRWIKIYRKN